jgi:alanine dehydrogenase
MSLKIGIRREDKNRWEARTPLVPEDIKELKEKHALEFLVQPSSIRAYSEADFQNAGAQISEDLCPCQLILGIKEMPEAFFVPGKIYIFFSHTIKGQPFNMFMLKKLLELGCTLIDYEKVTDEKNRRLIFFGNYAGFAGMIDTLWALGQKLLAEDLATPFAEIKQALGYHDLNEARQAIAAVGERLRTTRLPQALQPLVVGFAGYGNVSKGAQEILELLPVKEIEPEKLSELFRSQEHNFIYKAVFKEAHMVEPLTPGAAFELQDYYQHPEKYRSRFTEYLPFLTILVNGIYWEKRYPRLVTKADLKELFAGMTKPRLRVIGDISCDVEGAVECNLKITNSGAPVYLYNPETETISPGVQGKGVVVLAVDNLPCELPRDASAYFSHTLKDYIPALANANYKVPFEQLNLPPEWKKAVIAYQGQLTPDYRYLEKYLLQYAG